MRTLRQLGVLLGFGLSWLWGDLCSCGRREHVADAAVVAGPAAHLSDDEVADLVRAAGAAIRSGDEQRIGDMRAVFAEHQLPGFDGFRDLIETDWLGGIR